MVGFILTMLIIFLITIGFLASIVSMASKETVSVKEKFYTYFEIRPANYRKVYK